MPRGLRQATAILCLCHLAPSASYAAGTAAGAGRWLRVAARHLFPIHGASKRALARPAVQMTDGEGVKSAHFYPIGVKGVPWGEEERVAWRAQHKMQRSYKDEVLTKIDVLRESREFVVEQYGALSCDPQRYPLFVVKSKAWDASKPTLLVTVHLCRRTRSPLCGVRM